MIPEIEIIPTQASDSENIQIQHETEINPDDLILIPEKYIREEEKELLCFSKNGIVSLFETLRKDSDSKEWIKICNRNNLVIDYKNGVRIN